MKILVLGKGVANDGVVLLLTEDNLEFDYLNPEEVQEFDYDLVVKAPGIPYNNEIIKKFTKKKIKIITDIELAILLRQSFFIGVTGSNGKTTTVSLITHILNQRYKAIACGNIGYSVCKALVENPDADFFVVELSSFQLERTSIDLNISVLLNISPCHLDHLRNFKEYIDSKANICLNQSSNHYLVYNYDDVYIQKIISNCHLNRVSFSNSSLLAQCYVRNNKIYYGNRCITKMTTNLKNKEFLLLDTMAAISTCLLIAKINPRLIRKALKSFKEIDFRMTKLNDFIYNDAKSTNPYSTIAALKCFDEVSLICGGYDRKENLGCLNDYLNKIKCVYAYGDSSLKISEYMNKHNIKCSVYDNLEEAFLEALKNRGQETILFSPMFASFDHFKNYLERGNYFNELVRKYLKY